jgi:hypothetical protein
MFLFGSVGSIVSSNKARKSQERSNRVQQKLEQRAVQRERLSQLRESQIARASAIQGAVSSGTADSSGLQGQLSGIQSTTASNLAFSQQTETGVGVMNMYQRQVSKYRSQAATYSGIADMSLAVAKSFGGV